MSELHPHRSDGIAERLVKQLQSASATQRLAAADSIKDLGTEQNFRHALWDAGAVSTLVNLLSADDDLLATSAAQSLAALCVEEGVRTQIAEAGGVDSLARLLLESKALEQQTVLLRAALAAIVDESACVAFHKAGGLAVLLKVIESADDLVLLEMGFQMLGRLGHSKLLKNSIREQGGLAKMLRRFKEGNPSSQLSQIIIQAITILVVENEVNQDYIRENAGFEPLVKFLDRRTPLQLSSAAATCLTALCINNEMNKNQLRELWAIPLLVGLLEQENTALQEKAVDCIRVLTTGNDLNKLSFFSIPAGVRSLVRIMTQHQANEMITERAAAVIGNLSTTEQFFSAIRECGGLQRLVILLDSGAESRVTEIAAKALANMAGDDSSRKGIRLAGGLPPLVNLLTQRPSEQVLLATQEALRRLQVTNDERNAILETLRYCDQQFQLSLDHTEPGDRPELQHHSPHRHHQSRTLPLTQYSVEDTCHLLNSMGITKTDAFLENGVSGGDLLELSSDEMSSYLNLSPLQVKKLQNIKRAFRAFEAISIIPGQAEITQIELRDWLSKEQKKCDADVQAIVNGFKRALAQDALPLLNFQDFALHYQWLAKTLQVMRSNENALHDAADDADL